MQNQRSLSNWGKLLTWKIRTGGCCVALLGSAFEGLKASFPPAAGNIDYWGLITEWPKRVTLPRVTFSSRRSLRPDWLRGGVCEAWRRGLLALMGTTIRNNSIPTLELPVGLTVTTALQFRSQSTQCWLPHPLQGIVSEGTARLTICPKSRSQETLPATDPKQVNKKVERKRIALDKRRYYMHCTKARYHRWNIERTWKSFWKLKIMAEMKKIEKLEDKVEEISESRSKRGKKRCYEG